MGLLFISLLTASSAFAYTPATREQQVEQTALLTIIAAGSGSDPAIGGPITDGTAGSVLFVTPDEIIAQDNANFFWNDTSNRLGIGTNAPGQSLTVDGTIGILEGGGSPSFHTIFQGGDQSGNVTYTLPTAQGAASSILQNNGSGVMSWATSLPTALTAGSVPFSNGGILTQDNANLFWNDTDNRLGIGTAVPAESLDIIGGSMQLPVTTTTNGQIKQGGNRLLHTFGTNNTFLGRVAGNTTLSGANDNTAVGAQAMGSLTDGDSNTAFGYRSGTNLTTGSYNLAVGTQSLENMTTGTANIAIGVFAGQTINGDGNTAIGFNSLNGGGSGSSNIAIGPNAAQSTSSGSNNTVVGSGAFTANTTSSNSTAVGQQSLKVSTGASNTGMGVNSLLGTTSGTFNVAVGGNAGITNTTGSNNTLIGDQSDVGSNNLTNATAIGYLATVSASNALVLGNGAFVGIGSSSPTEALDVVGSVKITDSGANGGNTPHERIRRSSTTNTSATCAVTCSAGETVTGGGCQNSLALNMADSYPSADDTWSCEYTLATGNCTAWAVCFDY